MANTFQVVDWLCQESLRGLINNLAVASGFNTDYNDNYTKDFAVGETVRVKTGSGGYSGGIRAHTLALSMEKNKKMYRKELDNT